MTAQIRPSAIQVKDDFSILSDDSFKTSDIVAVSKPQKFHDQVNLFIHHFCC